MHKIDKKRMNCWSFSPIHIKFILIFMFSTFDVPLFDLVHHRQSSLVSENMLWDIARSLAYELNKLFTCQQAFESTGDGRERLVNPRK